MSNVVNLAEYRLLKEMREAMSDKMFEMLQNPTPVAWDDETSLFGFMQDSFEEVLKTALDKAVDDGVLSEIRVATSDRMV